MKTIFYLFLSLILTSCGTSSETKDPTENIDETVNFENVSESQLENRLRHWLKKNNFKEDQKIRIKKNPQGLQLQFQQAELDGTYAQILLKMRILAGASQKDMENQSDGFIEMSSETAERLIKALFKK